jgi:MEKHLA domain
MAAIVIFVNNPLPESPIARITMQPPWQDPIVIQHSQRLIASFQHWTGRSLLMTQTPAAQTPEAQAAALFQAHFVVVSHGVQADPIFNYGNQAALNLWEFDWDTFTQLPSRQSAEPVAQAERDRLLATAKTQGYIRDYQGVRISRLGRRFWIEDVILWDVLTATELYALTATELTVPELTVPGQNYGQAAMFANWRYCDSPNPA